MAFDLYSDARSRNESLLLFYHSYTEKHLTGYNSGTTVFFFAQMNSYVDDGLQH